MFDITHRGAKLAALIAAGVVVLGGVAAASGSLPTPAQSAAHDALGAAGIDVPDGDGAVASDDPATTTTTSDPTTTTTSESDGSTTDPTDATDPADAADVTEVKGPDPTGPAKFGLCTAYAAGQGSTRGHRDDSTAFRALAAAAAGEGESVTEFCADATPGGKPAPTTTTPTTAAPTLTDTGTETVTSGPAPATRPPHPAAANRGAASGPHGKSNKP